MIHIGLAGWGDHEELYPRGLQTGDKLARYAQHFSIVECDSTFYAIPKPEQFRRWAEQTPAHFQFVVKAYQGMTGHRRNDRYYSNTRQQFAAFISAIEPLRETGKLGAVLFQYPPWFDCQRKHVELLRKTRSWMGDIRCALEFRHQSWFLKGMREQTIEYMMKENWIHSICDEPQVGEGSIPIVPIVTDKERTVVRFHGRNDDGWIQSGDSNWREVRYLYRYSEAELLEWRLILKQLAANSEQVYVIFNNNSGGDAADNAIQLMSLLGQEITALPPKQIDLFDQ